MEEDHPCHSSIVNSRRRTLALEDTELLRGNRLRRVEVDFRPFKSDSPGPGALTGKGAGPANPVKVGKHPSFSASSLLSAPRASNAMIASCSHLTIRAFSTYPWLAVRKIRHFAVLHLAVLDKICT